MTLLFKSTQKLRQEIQNSLQNCNDLTITESLTLYARENTLEIPWNIVKQLIKINPDLDLSQLIRGSQIVLISPPERIKSEKLLKILKECQDIVDKKEYYRMTKGLDGKKDVNLRFKDVKFTIGQLSSVFNVIFSMAAVFTAVMYFGDQVGSLSVKLLLALFCAWIVGIAEGFFLFRDLMELQDQEERIGK